MNGSPKIPQYLEPETPKLHHYMVYLHIPSDHNIQKVRSRIAKAVADKKLDKVCMAPEIGRSERNHPVIFIRCTQAVARLIAELKDVQGVIKRTA